MSWPRRGLARVRTWRRGLSPMGMAAVVVSFFSLLPLVFVAWVTIQAGWATVSLLVFRPRVADLLLNTTALIVLTVPVCAGLAVALAWLTERTDLAGARVWAWVCVAPLAVPAFVQSYAWISLVPAFHGLFAGVTVSVLAYLPFLYLPVAATLRQMDPALEDVAASLGHGPWRVFRRVVVPQLRLAILGGSLLVALHLLAEYGLYAMIRFDTFATAIVEQFQTAFDGPAANMLASVLVVCCLLLLLLEGGVRGRARYARVGSGTPSRSRTVALGRYAPGAAVLLAATALLSIGVPMLTLGRWLLVGGRDVWRMGEILGALWQTLAFALAGGLLATLAAFPVAWIAVRHPGRFQRFLEGCNYIAGALPGVAVALALVMVTVRVALPLYQTVFTILVAYAIIFLPRALVSLRAAIAQTPVELEQAAGSLGHSPFGVMRVITLRLAAPGAAASLALVGLGIFNELTATQMLAPSGTQTLAMRFWDLSGELDYAAAAPYAVIMVAASLPLTWLLHVQARRRSGR
ncbi:ABC transporter permease [Azorhizobium doebereinerae]|uniref:ABC transporter permease n=1 Tax=Azorhizobium doebereinerae TaxID=281091 RepID=UPI0012EB4B78